MTHAPSPSMGRRSTGTAALLSPATPPARLSSVPPSRGLRSQSRSELELDAFLAAPVAAPTVLIKRPSRPPARRTTPAAPQPSESTLTVDIGEVELIDPGAGEAPAARSKLGWKVAALAAVLGLCAFGYLQVERPDVLDAGRAKISAIIESPAAPVLSAAPAAAPAPPVPATPVAAVAAVTAVTAAPVVVAQATAPSPVPVAAARVHGARAPHRVKPTHKAAPSVAAAAPAAPAAPAAAAPAAKPKGPVTADVHQSQRAAAQANQIIGNSL